MLELNNKNELLDLIHQGAVVVTPNNRLSASILSSYFTYNQGKTVIKPQCSPYTVLLHKVYEQLRFNYYEQRHPFLLNEMHCRYLWHQIIQETPGIIYNEGLLKSVMQAWKLCEQWQINPEDSAFSHTPQTHIFQQLRQNFNQKLMDLQTLNEYQLVPYLIKTQYPLFRAPIIWVCFDEFTPQQRSLQTYLSQQEIHQYRYDLSDSTSQPQLFAAENHKNEYEQLIQWLHLKMEQKEPRIGVVIPELQQVQNREMMLLKKNIAPSSPNQKRLISTYP